MSDEPTFTIWRTEKHYASIEYTLPEIQELLAGHIVDSELFGEDRLSGEALVRRLVELVNSGNDFNLTDYVNCSAELEGVPGECSDWQWGVGEA